VEVFDVLKSNPDVKHGHYVKKRGKKKIMLDGYFKNGLKDSVWTELNNEGDYITAYGMYKLDKKYGAWKYFNYKGELLHIYDQTTNNLLFFDVKQFREDSLYKVLVDGDTIKTQLDLPPMFLGGNIQMLKFLSEEIEYPNDAKESAIAGIVELLFTIDKSGQVKNIRTNSKVGGGCESEAVRAFKTLQNPWVPGILNGEAVDVELRVPVGFGLFIYNRY
jgi:periplasmic protein TonB